MPPCCSVKEGTLRLLSRKGVRHTLILTDADYITTQILNMQPFFLACVMSSILDTLQVTSTIKCSKAMICCLF